MAIVKMKKIELLVVSSQREELLKELMLLHCVQISEPTPWAKDGDQPWISHYKETNLSRYRSEFNNINSAIKILDKFAPVKTKVLAPLPDLNLNKLLDEKSLSEDIKIAEKIVSLDDGIRRFTAEESRLRSEIETLSPWSGMDMALDFQGTETCNTLMATMPAAADISAAEASLRDATQYAELISISTDRTMNYVVLVCMKPELEAAITALRSFGFSAMSMGEFQGTAKENMAELNARLAAIAEEKKKYAQEIVSASPYRDQLKLRADTLSTKIARAEAAAKLMCTDSVTCIEGWVPEEQEKELEQRLSVYDCAWETEDPKQEEFPEVPVKLKNNKFSRPLNMVTEMYSLPAYDGIDPNPLMAPFFILFYGLMLADVGYGLLMMLIGLLVLNKKKPKGGSRNFFELLFVCGISTLVCGIFTGGFFSNLIPTVAENFFNISPEQLPLWLQKFNNGLLFNPLDDTVMVLIGSMCLGVIQIITGMIIKFVETTKAGHFWDALMDQGSWWLVFIGIAVGALTGIWWVAIAGVAALILTQGRSSPTIIGKLVGGVSSLYDITGFFGDILSYSRIMALMLAGTVIGQVFNTLGAIPQSPVVFILIFLVGHSLNFGLNLLGCYVHDLRLQCLEFFGKFYKDGGRPFKPLSVDAKYYNIID